MLHHAAAVGRTFARLFRSLRSVFSVAGDFLDSRRHFVHGRGDLVDFVLLLGHASAGLFAARRKFFGSGRDLRDAVADSTDQPAQRDGHVLHGVQQQTQFVLTRGSGVLGQVAFSDATGGNHGVVQRHGDLTGNDEGREDAYQQHHQGHAQELHDSGVLFTLGTDHLRGGQLIGTGRCSDGLLLQGAADLIGLLQHFGNGRHQHFVLLQGVQCGVYCAIGFHRQLAACSGHLGDQRIGGVVGCLTVVGSRNAQVTAKDQTEIGHAVAQITGDLDLLDTGLTRRTQSVVDGFLQQVFESRTDLVRHLDQRFERVIDFLVDADQLIESLLQTADLFLDAFQFLQVARYDEHIQSLLDAATQGVQRSAIDLHTGSGGSGCIGLRGNTCIQDVILDFGDLAALAQALDQQIGA
ncbi:hypothetical protein PS689_04054 [Pseudomonas fluorescens]|nr:hypothetical protein PS689_04054 [Pseudomonas fluorescens]